MISNISFNIIDNNFGNLVAYLSNFCFIFSYIYLKVWIHTISLNYHNEIHIMVLVLRLRIFAIDGRKLWYCETVFLIIFLLLKLVSSVILEAK